MQHFFHFRGAMFNIKKILSFLICAFNLIFILSTAQAERIKDISQIFGIRHNQLVGYGLVVGLDGSGDSNAFTDQSFKTMLSRLGVQVPAGMNVSSKNVAAVAIHASLPPFARPGQQIDVLVSSIGSAKSLRGGSLLMAELKGADSQTYAVAQGNIVVAGFDAEGLDGSKIKVNNK
jgi:flagellar P-ring protein precursor FlgI